MPCVLSGMMAIFGMLLLNIIDYSTLLLLAVTKTRFSILIFKLGYHVISIGHVFFFWGGGAGGPGEPNIF
jgi:hypothetical protein